MSQASVNLTPIKIAVGLVLIYIAGGVNIYLYGCISLAPVCAVCQCVCCVISNQSTSKKPNVSDLSKLGACQKRRRFGGGRVGRNLRKGVGNVGWVFIK